MIEFALEIFEFVYEFVFKYACEFVFKFEIEFVLRELVLSIPIPSLPPLLLDTFNSFLSLSLSLSLSLNSLDCVL